MFGNLGGLAPEGRDRGNRDETARVAKKYTGGHSASLSSSTETPEGMLAKVTTVVPASIVRGRGQTALLVQGSKP